MGSNITNLHNYLFIIIMIVIIVIIIPGSQEEGHTCLIQVSQPWLLSSEV